MDGWMDGWMDAWMHGCMDNQTELDRPLQSLAGVGKFEKIYISFM